MGEALGDLGGALCDDGLDHGLGLLDVDLVALEGDGDLLVVLVVDVWRAALAVSLSALGSRGGMVTLTPCLSVMALRFLPLVPMTKARREAGIMMWVRRALRGGR